MAKYVIRRGRDAWTIEEAIIEAEDADDAEMSASWRTVQRELDWVETGEVRTYDDTEIMEGETRLLKDGETLEEYRRIEVTDAQFHTILAALRFYQKQGQGDPVNRDDWIHHLATNGDQVISLDIHGIDALCVQINT